MDEFNPCYVFDPHEAYVNRQKPSKRRKTNAEDDSKSSNFPFLPLLGGSESQRYQQSRRETLPRLWEPPARVIKDVIESANFTAKDKITSFLQNTDLSLPQDKIPVGLLLCQPGNGVPSELLQNVVNEADSESNHLLIELASSEVSNFKAAVRLINHAATSRGHGLANDYLGNEGHSSPYLNYDLQILYDIVCRQSLKRVILALPDGEAFNGELLSDLICLLNSWRDRIPFLLFIGISTSVELFQSKVASKAVQCLDGKVFEIERVDIERLFQASLNFSSNGNTPSALEHSFKTLLGVWVGSRLVKMIFDRQRDTVQSPQAFTLSLKYAYMSHLYANPLAALLAPNQHSASLTPEQLQALRCLPSFRKECERLLQKRRHSEVKQNLDDDNVFLRNLDNEVKRCAATLKQLTGSVDLCYSLQRWLTKERLQWSEIYVMAMSAKLAESDFLRGLLSSLKKAPSQVLLKILDAVPSTQTLPTAASNSLENYRAQLLHLIQVENEDLRSGHDLQTQNFRTTVVAQKVELSHQAAKLTKAETEYTEILDKMHALLHEHLQETLVDPNEVFPSEIFIYDLPSPYRDAFTPRPRSILERGLSRPYDYLGSDSLEGADEVIAPAIAVLYQMYLECGSLINAADLWSAFWTVMSPQAEDADAEKEIALALFVRALSEMKYLGIIRASQKKADHLSKLVWSGL